MRTDLALFIDCGPGEPCAALELEREEIVQSLFAIGLVLGPLSAPGATDAMAASVDTALDLIDGLMTTLIERQRR